VCVCVYALAKNVTLRRRHHSHYRDIIPLSYTCALHDGSNGGVSQMRDGEGRLGVPDEITREMWWPGAPVVWLPVCRRRRRRLVDNNTRRVSHPLFSTIGR